MRVHPPQPVILTAISTFQRRAPTHLFRRPRTGKIAMSAITRLYAEVGSALSAEMRLGFDFVPRSPLKVVQMPAKANSGRFGCAVVKMKFRSHPGGSNRKPWPYR